LNKHIYTIVVPLLVMVFGIQADVHAEGYKLGAIDTYRLLEKSPQADAARKMIDKEFEPRDRELIAAQKKLKGLEDKLAKDAAIMSESERKKLERDIISKRRELKRNQDEFQEDANFRHREELAKIQKKLKEAVKKAADEEKFDVIFNEAAVIYASPKVDITNKILEYLKEDFEGQGGE